MKKVPYESLVKKLCGDKWRMLKDGDLNAAWGILIVRSVLSGCEPTVPALAAHMKVSPKAFLDAFEMLSLNGIFRSGRIERDASDLRNEDLLTWGYYGGYASSRMLVQ